MNPQRRSLLAAAGSLTALACLPACIPAFAAGHKRVLPERLVLSSFKDGEIQTYSSSGWTGFSDRVMGGISNAEFEIDRIEGKDAIRLTGNVTRESNGGFIQMAYFFGRNYRYFDASDYDGIELLVYGNNEDYNVHVRTNDCRWYEQSYRHTAFITPEWQRLQIPWDAFTPNGVRAPLNQAELQRIAVVGWMREFDADISVAELALYKDNTIKA